MWVRNISKQPASSFWLQTSTDRLYPDFTALLHDGRVPAVEYKGQPYATNDDSTEKRKLGELWEARSNERALFLMAEIRDANGRKLREQIKMKIEDRWTAISQ